MLVGTDGPSKAVVLLVHTLVLVMFVLVVVFPMIHLPVLGCVSAPLLFWLLSVVLLVLGVSFTRHVREDVAVGHAGVLFWAHGAASSNRAKDSPGFIVLACVAKGLPCLLKGRSCTSAMLHHQKHPLVA